MLSHFCSVKKAITWMLIKQKIILKFSPNLLLIFHVGELFLGNKVAYKTLYDNVLCNNNIILPNIEQVTAKTVLSSLKEKQAREKVLCDARSSSFQDIASLDVKSEGEVEKADIADCNSYGEDNCYMVRIPDEKDKVILDWGDITQVIYRDSLVPKVDKSPTVQKKRVRRAIPSTEKSFLRAVYAEFSQKCSPAKITDIIMQIYSGDGGDYLLRLHSRFPNLAIPKKRVLNTHEQIYLCIYNNFVRKKK